MTISARLAKPAARSGTAARSRLGELEEDGEPTSGTASSVAEVYAREQRYLDEKGSPDEAVTEPERASDAERSRWGFLSGFCGADSMSFASAPLGGKALPQACRGQK